MSTATSTTSEAQARQRRVIMIAAAGAIVFAGAIWAVASLMRNNMPRLNDNAVVLAKFMRSSKFQALPFEQQRQFYKVMDDRDDELDQAFADKRLSQAEYRDGLEAAWLGKHINRVEKYFSLPPGQGRVNYITKLLEKRERKRGGGSDDGIKADETAAELKVESWPPAVRTQWEQFHSTYRATRKAREKASRPQTKPAQSRGISVTGVTTASAGI